MKKCYLQLADGHVFPGTCFGAEGETLGELVFTTGMVGYMETLTDPSYFGQIVMQTFPLIGNYGKISADAESRASFVRGYVVNEWCDAPSNFRSEGTLDEYLKENGIIGIAGVDTREITRIIRDAGVMNARITTTEPTGTDDALVQYAVTDALANVCAPQTVQYPADGVEKYCVALLDFGAKMNIVRSLTRRGCRVICLRYDTPAADVLALQPDGIMLTNGPGDPAENTGVIRELAALLGKKPIFGICLGHQLLALAAGAKTTKLKFGHRGANQPVTRLCDGRVFISSQNHGYAVVSETLPEGAELSFVNANDQTCEGVDYPTRNAFTVQFHPEAASGPHDTEFLFDRFVQMMEKSRCDAHAAE